MAQNEYSNNDKLNTINASKNGATLENSAPENLARKSSICIWEQFRTNPATEFRYFEYSFIRKQEQGLQL